MAASVLWKAFDVLETFNQSRPRYDAERDRPQERSAEVDRTSTHDDVVVGGRCPAGVPVLSDRTADFHYGNLLGRSSVTQRCPAASGRFNTHRAQHLFELGRGRGGAVVPTGGELWATDAGTRDDVVAQWEHILSATYLPWTVAIPELPEQNAFRGWVRRWPIDDILLADSRCGPCSGRRARHQPADAEGEFVVVMIIQAGGETLSQRHTEATLTAGDVVAWDSAGRNRFTIPESLSKRSMVIPRAALDEVGGRPWMRDGVTLDATAPATRLLTSHLATLSEVLPGLGSAAMSAARVAALELFVGALRTDSDVCSAEHVRPALRASIERYIAQNLLNGAVTPAAIAAAHCVSIRTVYRVFSATGQTVGEVVRARRLARARADVTDSDRPISVIAHRWGFSDTSHFSRTFKAHYGCSPTDYRIAYGCGGLAS
jgi:AraC family transcriptional regulator, positive regulator of tynA and feaB